MQAGTFAVLPSRSSRTPATSTSEVSNHPSGPTPVTRRVGDVPRGPLTQQDVDDVEARLEQTSEPNSFRAAAADYEAWANEPHPDDEVSVAALLVHAGEALEVTDDVEGALAYFERAVADGGEVAPDARCYVIGALLGLGRHDEADAATAAFMQSGHATRSCTSTSARATIWWAASTRRTGG